MFVEHEDQTFGLTPLGATLRSDVPGRFALGLASISDFGLARVVPTASTASVIEAVPASAAAHAGGAS